MNNYNGVVILDKPCGKSSHNCVSIARKAFNMKKIGHTGTLDPEASGVLPLLLGSATRASELITAEDKRYRAVILLGTQTDTLDMSGNILKTLPVNVTEADVTRVVSSFVGEIEQIPPMYSALSVNGQRLYALARQGIEVERKARKITIYSIDIVSVELPRIEIDVHCSKGTYIRTLAADIGNALGCGGCIEALRRTQCGIFDIANALTPDDLFSACEAGNAKSIIIPTDKLFMQYEAIYLDNKKAMRVKNGVPIYYYGKKQGDIFRIYDENKNFIALSEISEADNKPCLKLIKGFYQ